MVNNFSQRESLTTIIIINKLTKEAVRPHRLLYFIWHETVFNPMGCVYLQKSVDEIFIETYLTILDPRL